MNAIEFAFGAVDYIEGLAARYEPGTEFHATNVELGTEDGMSVAYVTFFQDAKHFADQAVATVWLVDNATFYGEW